MVSREELEQLTCEEPRLTEEQTVQRLGLSDRERLQLAWHFLKARAPKVQPLARGSMLEKLIENFGFHVIMKS